MKKIGNHRAKEDLTTEKRPYHPARLHVWGDISTSTRAGGSAGSGDVTYNPAGKPMGREDGSAMHGFDKH